MKAKTMCFHGIFVSCAATLLIILAFGGRALAQEGMEEAKERFKKGLMFVDEGDCKKALVEFEESYKLYPTTVVLYNMALCYDDLHQYGNAMTYYKKYMAESEKISKDQKKAIEERIATMEKFLGTLSITCNVDDASVLVDDVEIGKAPLEEVYLETGTHKLVVKKDNYQDFNKNVKMVSGKNISLEVELQPVEEDIGGGQGEGVGSVGPVAGPEEGKRKKLSPVIFWSMLGVTGALGAGAGAIGGLSLANHKKFLDTNYSDTKKWKDLKDKGELYNILFISLASAAGAAAVTTIVLAVFTDFKKGRKTKEETEPVAINFIPDKNGGFLMVTVPFGR